MQKSRMWKGEKVLTDINRMYTQGESVSSGYVQSNYSSLFGNARNFYGNWKNAVTAAGIDYASIRKNGKFIDVSLLDVIRRSYAEGTALNAGYVREHNSTLYSAGMRQFGSWENANTASGINYDSVREDKRLAQYSGRAFERVLDGLLAEIGILCTKQPTITVAGLIILPLITGG